MNKREWLVARGLAKPGRGRLSKEAHQALQQAIEDGVVFDEVETYQPYVPAPIKPWNKRRSIKKELIGYTKEGWTVGFLNCRRCSLHVNFCNCVEGVKPPSLVVSLDKRSAKAVEY